LEDLMDIFSKVKEIIVNELSVDEEAITMEARFIEDLGADSLDTAELIMKFEEVFDLSIPDDEAEKLRTVGDAVRYLDSRLN